VKLKVTQKMVRALATDSRLVHEVLKINGHHTFLSFNLELQQGAAKEEYSSN